MKGLLKALAFGCIWLMAIVAAGCGGTPTPVPAPGQAVANLRITNVTDSSFTVSWMTESRTTGWIRWGRQDSGKLDQTALDLRDSGSDRPTVVDQVHYVRVLDLSPGTQYQFDVFSGDATDNNSGAHYQVRLGPSLPKMPDSYNVLGRVYRRDGTTPAAAVIVYLHLRDKDGQGTSGESTPLSFLTRSGGEWLVNLAGARRADMSDSFQYSEEDEVVIEVKGAEGGTASLTTPIGAIHRLPGARLELK